MPSIIRSSTMPQVVHSSKSSRSSSSASSSSSSSSSKKERVVGFLKDPVSKVSRPVNAAESWAAYNFEMHARKCAYCHNPYEVHRAHHQLCEVGHRMAQEVAEFIYNRADGETYSTVEEEGKLVRVEVPTGYDEVKGLLKAIERSIRHRSRTPFVSMDRTYYVAARIPVPERRRSVKIEQPSKVKSRPRSGEIVDWPETPKSKAPRVFAEVNSSKSMRGSLYEQDLAIQRQNEKRYSVEVREPSARDLREHRYSGYYR